MVDFYTCGRKTLHFNKNTEHLTRIELLRKNNTWLEEVHDWIQILAPGTETSRIICCVSKGKFQSAGEKKKAPVIFLLS